MRALRLTDGGYPPGIAARPDAPRRLWVAGHLEVLERPAVAVVGTRRPTRVGLGVAHELGRDLAAAGVAVVSGLAVGIDAAAHRGALEGATDGPPSGGPLPVVGVVGSGLDVVYPAANRNLWEVVAHRGLLVSECPPGTGPASWHFPRRNRLIVALADVVVVVESRHRGGAMITARLGAEAGTPVLVVPGSVRSVASEGTNQLLADGAHPCLGVADVLVALGLTAAARAGAPGSPAPVRHGAGGDGDAVLEALGHEPATVDQLVVRSSRSLAAVTRALDRLSEEGLVVGVEGWWERSG